MVVLCNFSVQTFLDIRFQDQLEGCDEARYGNQPKSQKETCVTQSKISLLSLHSRLPVRVRGEPYEMHVKDHGNLLVHLPIRNA